MKTVEQIGQSQAEAMIYEERQQAERERDTAQSEVARLRRVVKQATGKHKQKAEVVAEKQKRRAQLESRMEQIYTPPPQRRSPLDRRPNEAVVTYDTSGLSPKLRAEYEQLVWALEEEDGYDLAELAGELDRAQSDLQRAEQELQRAGRWLDDLDSGKVARALEAGLGLAEIEYQRSILDKQFAEAQQAHERALIGLSRPNVITNLLRKVDEK